MTAMTTKTASPPRRLVKVSLSDQAYDELKRQILDQRLLPGARLNIDALSRECGISTSPLREALVRLSAEGLVVFTTNTGFSVAPVPDATQLQQYMEFRLIVAAHDITCMIHDGLSTIVFGMQLIFDSLASSLPYITAGKLRPLGITSATRSAAAPDLPTIAESGLPGYDLNTWYGLWAPAGTPPAIVDKLSAEVQKILKTPEIQKELTGRGIEPVGSLAAEFRSFNVSESVKWAAIVKESGATLD
jgi:DNA-binding transcriptional regulator YhcF (GntR family)